ncbi:MAG: hypothetical protein WDW36_009727 [Sanguina aurantia]
MTSSVTMTALGLMAGLLTSVAVPQAAAMDTSRDSGGWWSGRATFYGGVGDPWTIHDGSCGYGYIDSNVGTGDFVCAASDCNPDFGGSCGRCYEVKCDSGFVHDNYGQSFDRSNMCHDTTESVVVQVIDSCPCNYPTNGYSNKRWCCGDHYHLDLSIWAFERLADTKWGVIPLKVRTVDCGSHPDKMAQLRGGKAVDPVARPSYVHDRRPWAASESQN